MAIKNKDREIINDGSKAGQTVTTTPTTTAGASGLTYEDALREHQSQLNKPTTTQEQPSNTDYYDLLKNESYRAMLDSNIQAANARDQSTKYLGNMLAQKGFGGQGVAESTNLGVYSQYQNALSNARTTYNNDLMDIEKQRVSDNNDNFQTATTLMQEASNYDLDTLNRVMKNYGVEVDNEGNLSGGLYDKMDDNYKSQMQTLYDMYSSGLNNSASYSDLQSLQGANSILSDGTTVSLGETFNYETGVAFYHAQNGELNNGDVVKLENSSGNVTYLKWNGRGYQLATEKDYSKATTKYTAYRKDKKTYWEKDN